MWKHACNLALAGLCASLSVTAMAQPSKTAAEEIAAEEEQARRDTQAMFENIKKQKAERERLATVLPYPDELASSVPLPPSPWLEQTRRRYTMLLENFAPDVLLVPVQVQGKGIERANRALMNESLAAALPKNLRLAPPQLVARALGDGVRRIDRNAAIDLAEFMRAKRIVWVYAGHRDDAQLHLHFESLDSRPNGSFSRNTPAKALPFGAVPMPDTATPVLVFRQQLPKLVATLGYTPAPESRLPERLPAAALPSRFPAGLNEIAAPATPPVQRALYLQLLAALTPDDALRTREQLYERSLLMAWQLQPEAPATRLLLARAYYGLRMRSAGLEVLKQPKGDAELALIAALNGNLPELEKLRSRLGETPLGLMTELDATEFRHDYGALTAASEAGHARWRKALAEPWKTFANRRFADADTVDLHTVNLAPTLDQLGKTFPQAGPGLTDRLRAQAIVGRPAATVLENVLAGYLDPRLAVGQPQSCCSADGLPGGTPPLLALHDFLLGAGIADIVYQTRRMTITQGRYEDGLRYLDALDTTFGQLPTLIELRAFAEGRIASRADPAQRDAWLNRARQHDDIAKALLATTRHQVTDRPSAAMFEPIDTGDHPRMLATWLPAARAALINAKWPETALNAARVLQRPGQPAGEVRALLAGRFAGSGGPILFNAEGYRQLGQRPQMLAELEGAVAGKIGDRRIYRMLANEQWQDGRSAEAQKTLLAYPGLSADTRLHPLARDNYAFEAGAFLFWRGEPDLAAALFKIAAGSTTGSDAGLQGTAALALLDQDYRTALLRYRDSLGRYDALSSHRNTLGLLYLLGEARAGDTAFRADARRIAHPDFWSAALAGQRIAGLDASKIAAWTKNNLPAADDDGDAMLTRHLTRAILQDRKPDAAGLRELEARKKYDVGTHGAAFATALLALRQNDLVKAEAALAAHYASRPLDGEASSSLPYYALIAGRLGKPALAEAVLNKLPKHLRDDAYPQLARAVLDGLARQPDALRTLRQALDQRDSAVAAPISLDYAFVDLADQLALATGQTTFADFALELARASQRTLPWEAWSHAYVATRAKPGPERKEALRRAVFLDRQSYWLSALPATELDAASRSNAGKSPFTLKPASPPAVGI